MSSFLFLVLYLLVRRGSYLFNACQSLYRRGGDANCTQPSCLSLICLLQYKQNQQRVSLECMPVTLVRSFVLFVRVTPKRKEDIM